MSGLGDKLSGPPLYIWPWLSAMQMLKLSHPKGMQQTHIFQIQCPIPNFSVFSFIVTLIEIIVQICFLNFLPSHSPLDQWSPTFLAPGTGFLEGGFFMDSPGGCFGDDSNTLYFLCSLFLLLLHQLHRRSPGIRSQKLGIPVLDILVFTTFLKLLWCSGLLFAINTSLDIWRF